MKSMKDEIDVMFQNNHDNWDIKELPTHHSLVFMQKITSKKAKKHYWRYATIAACILIGFGYFINQLNSYPQKNLKFASKETQQTDSIFTVLIAKELYKIQDKKSDANQKMVEDALKQMKEFDKDYQNILFELEKNGENKILIKALISNFQTRISFLEEVLKRIEEHENIENNEKIL